MQGAPKLKVAIVGGGLAGLSTAVELLDQGYDVDIYEQRPFIGGKVASYKDRSGNHVEMGLHVFFGWVVRHTHLMAVHVWLQPALLLLHPTLHVVDTCPHPAEHPAPSSMPIEHADFSKAAW